MKAICGSTVVLGVLVLASSCNHTEDQRAHAKDAHIAREPSASEERRAEERRAEQRRGDERKGEERREGRFIGGGPAEPTSAVARIASARCDREVRCNNVGTKEKFSSRADCVMRMQDDKRDAINESDCPGGIDKKQLNACLSAIQDEACGNPLDAISRLVSCRSTSICVK